MLLNLTIHKTAPITKNYLAQYVNNAEIEKTWSKSRIENQENNLVKKSCPRPQSPFRFGTY